MRLRINTYQIFGLTNLLGFRFAPRLRNISDCKLYYIEKKTILKIFKKL
ncbi:Tn3 family transposase [Clostridium gasigenes]|nr:transposase [Clostridium gasigenes]QSW18831.1 Tn3 family transposase [Clostridium gasigenes]